MATVNKASKATPNITVNDIRITSVDRSTKDIAKWRASLRQAEQVSNPDRSRLYDLYEEILLDGHLTGIVRKRIDTVLNKEIEFLDKSGKKVPEMDAVINSGLFRELVQTILETRFWGVSGVEFFPGASMSFVPIPRKHIKPEQQVISKYQNSADGGIPFANLPFVWIMHDRASAAHRPLTSSNMSLGLLLNCAPYVIYKKDTLGDWAQYIEIFGQPVRIIKYDGQDEQTKIQLKQILDEAGNGLALLIPEQANFELLDGKTSNGTGELQDRFIEAMNQELSVTVLGNTETTTNGKTGTGAKSDIHRLQQEEIAKSDIAYVTYMLNDPKLLNILASYGLPVAGGHFAFTKQIDITYLKERITIDKELANIIDIAPEYWYDTYGIPKPANEEPNDSNKPDRKPKPSGNKQQNNPDKNNTGKLRALIAAARNFFD